ncbi:type II toxin-antitoxin system PemK/MazF family toxin [Enterococcus casseliflavus]
MEKKRPSVVVSNDYYNKSFNTILVMPLSSSKNM